jgi:large subunit ribosomal protein L10
MNREQKAAVIDEIAVQIQESAAIFAVDYRGITVPQAADLRDKLRAIDASFKVVKNSLAERAAEQVGAEHLKPLLAGPTALTFVGGDAATAAKTVADFARTTPDKLTFKGGTMDGAPLSPDQVTAISKLPPRDVLYGQLVGLVASPLTGLVRTLNALIGGLAVALGGVLEKKESGEIPAGPPPVAAAVAEPAEPVEEAPAVAGVAEPVEEAPAAAGVAEPVEEAPAAVVVAEPVEEAPAAVVVAEPVEAAPSTDAEPAEAAPQEQPDTPADAASPPPDASGADSSEPAADAAPTVETSSIDKEN